MQARTSTTSDHAGSAGRISVKVYLTRDLLDGIPLTQGNGIPSWDPEMGNNQPGCPLIWDHERWFETYTLYRKISRIPGKMTMISAGIVCEKDGVFLRAEKAEEGWIQYRVGRKVSLKEAAGEFRKKRR